MELTLLSSADLRFKSDPKNKHGKMSSKQTTVIVSDLKTSNSGLNVMAEPNFLTNLEGLILAQASRETKWQRLVSTSLIVRVNYGPISPTTLNQQRANCMVEDKFESYGLLKQLVNICGGHKNITASVELEFETHEREYIKLNFEELTMKTEKTGVLLSEYVNLPDRFSYVWCTCTMFLGSITLNLKLNDEALNWVSVKSLAAAEEINRRLLEDAPYSGDTVIVAENGVNVKCHKIFLIGQSDVFRAMFKSDMKEANTGLVDMPDISEKAIRALLAYLYIGEIKEPLRNSQTAVELLRVADKYEVTTLFVTMRDVILSKGNDWFSVEAGVQLILLAKKRTETPDFKHMEEKARVVLRSKSPDELRNCEEFSEQFCNPESGMEMCFCLFP